MEYRTLGQAGLKISALSFGASSLGGVFREVNESDCIRTVHVSLEMGINFIDTSPYCGLTKPDVATTLVGSANPAAMEKNVRWAGEPIDRQLLEEVLAILKPVHNLTWPSGRPENN